MKLANLSDAQLLASVKSLCGQARAVLARLLSHLVEVEKRCTFTDAEGHRCSATTWLELDHVVPRGRGGTKEPGNLRVRCRAHNLLYAEQTFGKEHVARKIRESGDPRQRGYASESCELAASGLKNMGFRRAEVWRALENVGAREGRYVTSRPITITD